MNRIQSLAATLTLSVVALTGPAFAAEPAAPQIHLEQYNGYFSARETLAGLQPGTYEFIVTNKAGKLAGFQIQNLRTRETLAMFPLQPGETQSALVEITADGVRYRCPINPTPWYEVDSIKAAN